MLPSKIKLLSKELKPIECEFEFVLYWIKRGTTHTDRPIIRKNFNRSICYNFPKGSTLESPLEYVKNGPILFSYQAMIDRKHKSFRYMEWHNFGKGS